MDIPEGTTDYATSVTQRTYLQRCMYKRFIKGSGDKPNRYVKNVMADNLNIDLKDNDGGFNCGKPSGWIEDYKSLPEATKELIKSVKRVRVILGTVDLIDPVDANGNSVEVQTTPFIWEIDNRDAFKTVGACFTKLAKMKRLPVQHMISAQTEERKLPNGSSFYLPTVNADFNNALSISQEDHETFSNFMGWVDNYNNYIISEWNKKSESLSSNDEKVLDEFHSLDDEAPF